MESGELEQHGVAVCEQCSCEFRYVSATRNSLVDEWRYWSFYPRMCKECADAIREKYEAESRERERVENFKIRMSLYSEYHDVGSRLARASFAVADMGAHNTTAFKASMRWLENPESNLIIVGGIGTGKSYLAGCLYQALLAGAHPVLWLNAASYMATVKRGFSDREQAEIANQKARYAEEAPFLVLDDLGKVHPGKDVSYTEEQFYAIVDARYRNELPTIVTTEWKSKALAERVGESVVSRLEDGAVVAGVKRAAEPYRKPKAA